MLGQLDLLAFGLPLAAALACAQALVREGGWRWRRFGVRAFAYAALGFAVAAAALRFDLGARDSAALAAVVVAAAAIVESDARWRVIPDVGWLALVAAALLRADSALENMAFGVLAAGGLFLAVREAFHALRGVHGLGLGDVKLAAAMGALLGPLNVLPAVAAATGATAIILAARLRLGARVVEIEGRAAAPLGIGLACAAVGALAWLLLAAGRT